MASRREFSPSASTRRSLFSLVVCALIVSAALLVPATVATAEPAARPAARAAVVDTGSIAGHALTSRGTVTKLRVLLFDNNWGYIRDTRTSSAGGYQFLKLPPGFYRVQFMDARPRYDIKSFGTSDIQVQVRVGQTTVRDARMSQGAFITGVVRVGPRNKAAAYAKVAAAAPNGQAYEVTANSKGQFAIGGLPTGSFTVWGWDHNKRWANKPIRVRSAKRGHGPHVRVPLRKRAGAYHGFLFAGPNVARGTVWATLVNRSTGQWYPFPIRNGDISIKGLMPGSYKIEVPGSGNYLGGTFSVPYRVYPQRSSPLNPRLTKLGGWIYGTVKTSAGDKPLAGVHVSIFDRYGGLRHTVITAANGTFRAGGSLETQNGMTLVAEAYERIDGLTYAKKYTLAGLNVTAGLGTNVGELVMTPVTGPETTISSGPAEGSTINSTSASFEFTGGTGTVRFECSLDGVAYSTCASPQNYTDLKLGKHSFQVRAIDASGTPDAVGPIRNFTVADTTAPDTTVTGGPDEGSSGTSTNVTFTFNGTAGDTAKLECSLDAAAFATCTSPKSYTLAVGVHKFQVRAVDAAGNSDASPVTRNFTVLAK